MKVRSGDVLRIQVPSQIYYRRLHRPDLIDHPLFSLFFYGRLLHVSIPPAFLDLSSFVNLILLLPVVSATLVFPVNSNLVSAYRVVSISISHLSSSYFV